MRDQYKDFAAAAVGPNSTAYNSNINVWKQAASELDLPQVAVALGSLRKKLRTEDIGAEHDEEIGLVSSAEKAAKKGDELKTLTYLKEAGAWVFEVATKIGEEVAAKVITTAMGLPGGE